MKVLKYLGFLIILLAVFNSFSQSPVTWKYAVKEHKDTVVELQFIATIQTPWHLYSHDMAQGGPIPTSFNYESTQGLEFIGEVTTSIKPIAKYDKLFMMEVKYFDRNVVFSQKVKNTLGKDITLKGFVEFMCCDDNSCLPPDEDPFVFTIKAADSRVIAKKVGTDGLLPAELTDEFVAQHNEKSLSAGKDSMVAFEMSSDEGTASTDVASADKNVAVVEEFKAGELHGDRTVLWIFIAGFLGGLLALLTPCVYPMIPLTVSMFMKGDNKARGVFKGVVYGISIIVLYVSLGWGLTLIFGGDILNWIASDPWVNLFLFVLLVIFAISFFGAFELTLPSSWSNFFDKKADKSTGMLSIFFMAITLAIVSFSCTGPIIGSLLSEAASQGNQAGIVAGMFGFSLALALPFSLFAIFPSVLQGMPKSGGWLNSVKVVLGFLELALALKFFGTADMVAHWNILSRDMFIAIWVVLFILLGIYLLGKIKFAHDSDLKYVSVPRLFMAIVSFSFAVYLIPGLWGAPLKSISAFAPHMHSQDFNLGKLLYEQKKADNVDTKRKYADKLECPLGISCFFDYDEALAYAKEVNKPLLLDFTGHSCTNCREMEYNVWSDPSILNSLKQDFVVASLYTDDRTLLPEEEQFTAEINGKEKQITTLGKKMVEFQSRKFKVIAQPYYVILGLNEELLVKPKGRDLNINSYKNFLDTGIENFNKKYR